MNDVLQAWLKDKEEWLKRHKYTPEKLEMARIVLEEVREGADVLESLRSHPLPEQGGGYLGKHHLVAVYRQMVETGQWEADPALLRRIRMKPGRTLSGVTTVTVLTEPYPCPGDCLFCPSDDLMPKSYIIDEPGASRAYQNEFDPYRQVRSRIDALEAVGHPTDKIELLILGGSWTAYPKDYQEQFIKRCFDAMNEVETANLIEAQGVNETAPHRNVGLVIETRQDLINPKVISWLRYLGVTKVQMGAQSLDDRILKLNKRGHDAAATLKATAMLRAGGFKIVLHWMPNLHGATLVSDREDFARLWASADDGLGYCPDEIKIYPTQLLEKAELYEVWKRGEYTPYTTEELLELIVDIKPTIPVYSRVNRVVRDIPSHHVVNGNKRTSLRQDVFNLLEERGQTCRCVRCREIRGKQVSPDTLQLQDEIYHAAYAEEHFLSYVTPDDKLAGYLRLSLPDAAAPDLAITDLDGAALIREVHVYGQSLEVGTDQEGAAQHIGLGTNLLKRAAELAKEHGFKKLAVIAAIGTRQYYENRGFKRGELYLVQDLD
jgi:elongator complex protein 3